MKIISMSDIHGDFETFGKALEYVNKSDADVLTINGDLSGRVFEGNERNLFVNINKNLQSFMPQIYNDTQGKINTLHSAAEFLKSNRVNAQKEVKELAENYLNFEENARTKIKANYLEFRDRFKQLEQKIVLIPGNWDGKFIDDFLAHYNLHHKYFEEVEGIKFIGYGGSNMCSKELPVDLITNYNSDELFNHLCKHEDAEVVLTHNIPRGFEGNGSKYPGEYSLLAYLYKNSPSLILTGHTHAPSVVKEPKTGTIVANPGNLGRYENHNFGTFLELEIDKNMFVKPLAFHQVNKNSIETHEIKEPVSQ